MTEFKRALDAVGWGTAECARRIGINRRTVERWYSGVNEAPVPVVAWLWKICEAIDQARIPIW